MATVNILLPSMGEGVIEATINKWLVSEGSLVKEDDPLVEVATDKVDSEIPAPADGKIVSVVAHEGSVVKVGDVIAVIEHSIVRSPDEPAKIEKEVERIRETISAEKKVIKETETVSHELKSRTPAGKFLSPLVKSIASTEKISYADLDQIEGTGMDGRITKDDIFRFAESRKVEVKNLSDKAEPVEVKQKSKPAETVEARGR